MSRWHSPRPRRRVTDRDVERVIAANRDVLDEIEREVAARRAELDLDAPSEGGF